MIASSIIQKCIKREPSAQKALYEGCAAYVYTIVKSYISDEFYIKDVMQEAFAAIFNSLHNYDENKGEFKSWIAKVTTYKSIDHLKAKNKIILETQLDVVETLTEESFSYLDELSLKDIETLLTDMPPGYKTIFMLAIIDEYPHTEISEMLDISAETSRSQLHRALKWIKKNIAQNSKFNRHEAL